MNEIIKIQPQIIGSDQVDAVNSRDIYEYLGVKAQYANWIQRAIDKYDFEEGVDFNIFAKPNNNQKDYIVDMDMAKELCMVSNTQKGKETRKYFISVEKAQNKPLTIEQLLKQNQQMLEVIAIENKQLKNQVVTMKPKANFADSVSNSKDLLLIGEYAKLICTKGYKIGQNRLFKWLKEHKYLQSNNQPYQKYIDLGIFEIIERTGTTSITGKGQIYILSKLKENTHE